MLSVLLIFGLCLLVPTEHLDNVAEQHAAALAPVIAGLQEEVTALRADIDQQWLQANVAEQELAGMKSRLAEVCCCMSQNSSQIQRHQHARIGCVITL